MFVMTMVSLADQTARFERARPRLFGIAYRMLGAIEDAEDLVQDTVVQAIANRHLWQAGSNLRAWLVTIMRNQFLASVARSHRSVSALETFVAADLGSASDPCEARLTLRDVERALRRLPSKQRSAIRVAEAIG